MLGLTPLESELTVSGRLRAALSYSIGLEAAGREQFTKFDAERLRWDLDKYAWLLSGRGAFGDRWSEDELRADPALASRQMQQGFGTSVGGLGLLLALIALVRVRRRWGMVLLGLGFFVGNLAYYLYMHPVDNLDFTIPGLVGLAILVGVGMAAGDGGAVRGGRLAFQAACLAVPVFLLVTNMRYMDPRTPDDEQFQRICAKLKETRLPERPVILSLYRGANLFRYVYWLERERSDVHVLIVRERYGPAELGKLINELRRRGDDILISMGVARRFGLDRQLSRQTRPELRDVGLFQVYPSRKP